MNPLSRNPGSAPAFWAWLGNRLISYEVFCIIPAELRQARNAGFKFCLGCSKIDHDNNCHSLDVCKPDAVSLVTKSYSVVHVINFSLTVKVFISGRCSAVPSANDGK